MNASPDPMIPPASASPPDPASTPATQTHGLEPIDPARAAELLARAGAVDVELASLALEAQMLQAPRLGLVEAIDRLAQRKPFLFEPRGSAAPAGAMPAKGRGTTPATEHEAAERAASTGLRADLLRYLRLRRSR